MKTEKASMRELVMAVGGPLEPDNNRKGWLEGVAETAGISFRAAKAAFYGEATSRATERKLRAAAGRREAEHLAKRFEGLASALNFGDADFHSDTIAALVSAARVLRGLDSARNHKAMNEAETARGSTHGEHTWDHRPNSPGRQTKT